MNKCAKLKYSKNILIVRYIQEHIAACIIWAAVVIKLVKFVTFFFAAYNWFLVWKQLRY